MNEERDEFLEIEFDFSKAIKNPYVKELKKAVTIKLSPSTINYFKGESIEIGIPYRMLINLYLDDCAPVSAPFPVKEQLPKPSRGFVGLL